MKIGCISDTHISVWQKNDKMFHHIEETFDAFYELCDKNDVGMIVHFGDFFHTKTMTSTEGLIRVVDIVLKFAKRWPFYIIVGNHDTGSINRDFSLPQVFKGYSNVTIIDKYLMVILDNNTAVHFIPYYDQEQLMSELISINPVVNCSNYLFGHFGVKGYLMNDTVVDNMSLCSDNDLTKFKTVYLGHYHGYQSHKNITYISSPIQLKHGDEKQDHGFLIIDTEQHLHTFVNNENTPQYVTAKLTKKTYPIISNLQNCYIRLFVPKKVSKEHLIVLKDKLMQSNYDVKIEHEQEDVSIGVVDGWDDILTKDAEQLIEDFAINNNNIFIEKGWKINDMLELVLKNN